MERRGQRTPDEAMYRSIFDKMSEAVVIVKLLYDSDGSVNDYVMVAVNPAHLVMTGLKEEQVVGKRAREILPNMEPVWFERVTEVVRTQRSITFEEHQATLGKWFKVSVSPLPEKDHLAVVFEDVTEQKWAEEALRMSREDLNRAQEVAQTGSWRLRLPSEELLWSEAEYRIFGVPVGTPMTYQKFLDIVHPDDRKYVDEMWAAGMRGEPYDIEHRIIVHGEVRWVREKAVLEVEGGVLKAGFGTTQDITERKRTEEELRRSNEELKQFAYVASHDLQEPLRMVTSYLGLLNKRYGDGLGPEAKEFMGYAFSGSQRMKQLIDDLLQYSRLDSKAAIMTPVDMNEVTRSVVNDLHVAAHEANAKIVVDELPIIRADKSRITQVLTNLLSNAVKFHGPSPPRVEVSAEHRGNDWIFAVKDNGIGIDPRYHENLFKMFQRLHTQDEYPGTGVGLAIAKKVIEQHGGRIWLESEVGKGSTFFFSIPDRGE